MGRPVVFLDFDGVINSHDWWRRRGKRPEPRTAESDARWAFDSGAVQRLNRLADAGADFVISSTWRIHPTAATDLPLMLRACGFTGTVIGMTPDHSAAPGTVSRILYVQRGNRGGEIREWLDANGPRPYVILDDDNDGMEGMALVQTDFESGLLDEHVDAALACLFEVPPPSTWLPTNDTHAPAPEPSAHVEPVSISDAEVERLLREAGDGDGWQECAERVRRRLFGGGL